MPHDDQYTATGPDFITSGQPKTAFSNNSNNGQTFTYGVNVIAGSCGVLGMSGLLPINRDAYEIATGELRAGVIGLSADRGVVGMGVNFGVYGQVWHDSDDKSDYGGRSRGHWSLQ